MSEHKKFISIWLFVGVLLLIYGVLILGAGIWNLGHPPERVTVLANLHAQIWWGALLIILGAVYTWTFRPGKE
jgi:hypothetical protein